MSTQSVQTYFQNYDLAALDGAKKGVSAAIEHAADAISIITAPPARKGKKTSPTTIALNKKELQAFVARNIGHSIEAAKINELTDPQLKALTEHFCKSGGTKSNTLKDVQDKLFKAYSVVTQRILSQVDSVDLTHKEQLPGIRSHSKLGKIFRRTVDIRKDDGTLAYLNRASLKKYIERNAGKEINFDSLSTREQRKLIGLFIDKKLQSNAKPEEIKTALLDAYHSAKDFIPHNNPITPYTRSKDELLNMVETLNRLLGFTEGQIPSIWLEEGEKPEKPSLSLHYVNQYGVTGGALFNPAPNGKSFTITRGHFASGLQGLFGKTAIATTIEKLGQIQNDDKAKAQELREVLIEIQKASTPPPPSPPALTFPTTTPASFKSSLGNTWSQSVPQNITTLRQKLAATYSDEGRGKRQIEPEYFTDQLCARMQSNLDVAHPKGKTAYKENLMPNITSLLQILSTAPEVARTTRRLGKNLSQNIPQTALLYFCGRMAKLIEAIPEPTHKAEVWKLLEDWPNDCGLPQPKPAHIAEILKFKPQYGL